MMLIIQAFQENMWLYSTFNLLFLFYVLKPTSVNETLLWVAWFSVTGIFDVIVDYENQDLSKFSDLQEENEVNM